MLNINFLNVFYKTYFFFSEAHGTFFLRIIENFERLIQLFFKRYFIEIFLKYNYSFHLLECYISKRKHQQSRKKLNYFSQRFIIYIFAAVALQNLTKIKFHFTDFDKQTTRCKLKSQKSIACNFLS